VGAVVFDPETAQAYEQQGKAYILTRSMNSVMDVQAVQAAAGIITRSGSPETTSDHVCLDLDIPAVIDVSALEIDFDEHTAQLGDSTLHEGDIVSFDGLTGEIFSGLIPTVPSPALQTLLELLPY
jgi:pyruvate,orthophosphate dikinase